MASSDSRSRFVRQHIALASHHGGGDRARIAADDGIDPAGKRVAAAIDGHRRGSQQPGRAWRGYDLDPAEDAPDRAKTRKPRIAREIIATGKAGVCRGKEPCLEAHIGASLEGRSAAQREPDPVGRLAGRKALRRLHPQEKPRARPAIVHLLDEAF